MTFGVGNDVDAAIVVQTVGIGQGKGGNRLFSQVRRVFHSPTISPVHGKAFVHVPLASSTKNGTKAVKITGGWGASVSCWGVWVAVEFGSGNLGTLPYKSESPVGRELLQPPWSSLCPHCEPLAQGFHYTTQSWILDPTTSYAHTTYTARIPTHNSYHSDFFGSPSPNDPPGCKARVAKAGHLHQHLFGFSFASISGKPAIDLSVRTGLSS